MSDISKCSGEGCQKKQNCYRFTAKASYYQSYFMNPPIKEDGTCEYYWGERSGSIGKQLEDIIKSK